MSKLFWVMIVIVGLSPFSSASVAQSGVRLFLTPEIRLELERLRLGIGETVPEPKPTIVETITDFVNQEPEPDVIYALGGSMLKSDGSSTVWLNGVAVDERSLPAGVRIEKPAAMGRLIVTANKEEFVIKPGQVLNATTGVIYEAYQWQQQLEMKRIEELSSTGQEQLEELSNAVSDQTP